MALRHIFVCNIKLAKAIYANQTSELQYLGKMVLHYEKSIWPLVMNSPIKRVVLLHFSVCTLISNPICYELICGVILKQM